MITELIDTYSEMVCLGGVIKDSGYLTCLTNVVNSDFSDPLHQEVHAIVMDLWTAGEDVNSYTVEMRLKDKDKAERLDYMLSQVASGVQAENASHVVHNLGRLRNLVIETHNAIGNINKHADINDIVGKLSRIIIENQEGRATVELMSRIGKKIIQQIDDKLQLNLPKGLNVGLKPLDNLLNGLPPKCFVVIGGRTSTGKTALALSIASHVSQNNSVLFCTGEMSPESLFVRSISTESGLETKTLFRPLSQTDYLKFKEGLNLINKKKFYLMESHGYSVDRLHGELISAFYKIKPKLIIVDYLQLVARSKQGLSPYQATSEASGFFKRLTDYIEVPVIVMSQVSRMKGDKRQQAVQTDKIIRLSLQDLRDSGNIEQDADLVLFIQSPGTRKEDATEMKIEIELAKNRLWGGTGRWKYNYHLTTQRFEQC